MLFPAKKLDGTQGQAIICRQFIAIHLVGFRQMKRKKKNASNDNSYFSWKALGNDIASWPVESHTNLINLLAPIADTFATFY